MKTKLLVATALVVANFTSIVTSPALGQIIVDPDVQLALNAQCLLVVNAAHGNGPFEITAIVLDVGNPTGGTVTTEFVGTEHRHGGSPNIFRNRDVTTSGGTTIYSVDCETFNPNAAEGSGGQYPYGQQVDLAQIPLSNTGPGETVHEDPVVCNSPTKNPGTWRGQNGYTNAQCATLGATFYSLVQEPDPVGIQDPPIPSSSLPQ
jgi:hypothetical protein